MQPADGVDVRIVTPVRIKIDQIVTVGRFWMLMDSNCENLSTHLVLSTVSKFWQMTKWQFVGSINFD